MHFGIIFPRKYNALHRIVVKFDIQFEKVNAIKGEKARRREMTSRERSLAFRERRSLQSTPAPHRETRIFEIQMTKAQCRNFGCRCTIKKIMEIRVAISQCAATISVVFV